MAMPTRSVRTTEFGEKAPTPVAIGPGSYLGIREATKTRPSLAGFASSEPRSWQGGASTPTGPGPGSYVGSTQAVPNENDIRPTSCFESRAPRLAPQYTGSTPFASSTVVEVPGPGSYQTSPPIPGAYVQPESHGVWPRHESVPGLAKRFNPPSVPRCVPPFYRAPWSVESNQCVQVCESLSLGVDTNTVIYSFSCIAITIIVNWRANWSVCGHSVDCACASSSEL